MSGPRVAVVHASDVIERGTAYVRCQSCGHRLRRSFYRWLAWRTREPMPWVWEGPRGGSRDYRCPRCRGEVEMPDNDQDTVGS